MKSTKLFPFAVAALLCLAPLSASAKSKGGVTMPDTMSVAGKNLVLNGMGIREATVLKVDVYVAGLYLEKKTSDFKEVINSEQVKRIHLKFVRDVDSSDIKEAWEESLKKNAGKAWAKDIKPYVPKLNGWMPKFKEGDTLTFTYAPGKGLTVEVNGSQKGVISDVFFSRVLFSVFVGRAPNEGLKKGLLGK